MKEIGIKIIEFMKKDKYKTYSRPDIMEGIKIKNREKVTDALARLEVKGKIVCEVKGRARYYRLVL